MSTLSSSVDKEHAIKKSSKRNCSHRSTSKNVSAQTKIYVSEFSFFWKIFKQVILNDSKNHYGIHQGSRRVTPPMFITAWLLPKVGCLSLTWLSRIRSFGLWGTSVTGPGKASRGLSMWFRHLSSLSERECDSQSPLPSVLCFPWKEPERSCSLLYTSARACSGTPHKVNLEASRELFSTPVLNTHT